MRGAVMQAARDPDSDDDGPPPMLITTDPPKHDRLRELVNRGFTPRRIGALEPRLRAICGELVHALAARGEIDFIGDFAVPFPVRVIAEMLGVEPHRFEDFKRWSRAVVAVFGRFPSPEERAAAVVQLDEMGAYVEEMVARRRDEPADDLLSLLVAKEQQEVLTLREAVGFAILLLVAGNETTTNLLGSTLLVLRENPDVLERVTAEPRRIPDLIEEALRYTSPIQLLFRQVQRDTVLGGVELPAGAIVLPCFAAANRDPRRFPDPDRFDIDRNTQGHLAFGLGVHFCLGAGLARLEARVALEAWLPRLASWHSTGEPLEWVPSPFVRGPLRLPLARSLARAAS
jgi:cytochrome P450